MIKFIAEIGSNHNGEYKRATKLIDEANKAGCWAVKFQLFNADRLYTDELTTPEIVKRQLPINWIARLSNYCKTKKIKFGITPFDIQALLYIKKYVDFIKISSFDVKRKDLIKTAAKTDKQLFISLGLCDYSQLVSILSWFKEVNRHPETNSVLMHCVSKYPTNINDACMGRVNDMDVFYGGFAEIGYSDHTSNEYAILAAVINRAKYIELHFDLDDGEGWEYSHGHCWKVKEVRSLINAFDNIDKANYGEFKLTSNDLIKLANPTTGLREHV